MAPLPRPAPHSFLAGRGRCRVDGDSCFLFRHATRGRSKKATALFSTEYQKGLQFGDVLRPMTKQELITGQKAFARSASRNGLVIVVVIFGLILGLVEVGDWFDRAKPKRWILYLSFAAFAVLVIGCLSLLTLLSKRDKRRFHLMCPHCGAPLLSFTGQIVIATGNCGRCTRPTRFQTICSVL